MLHAACHWKRRTHCVPRKVCGLFVLLLLAMSTATSHAGEFFATDFESPMGKKKKIGSKLPVKFQLFYEESVAAPPIDTFPSLQPLPGWWEMGQTITLATDSVLVDYSVELDAPPFGATTVDFYVYNWSATGPVGAPVYSQFDVAWAGAGVVSITNINLSLSAGTEYGLVIAFEAADLFPGSPGGVISGDNYAGGSLWVTVNNDPWTNFANFDQTIQATFTSSGGGTVEVVSQAQLDQLLIDNGGNPSCPEIVIWDVTTEAQELEIELPDDQGNSGEGGDLGTCFRFEDGRWIFNLDLDPSSFAADRTYLVDAVLDGVSRSPGNELFQTK